MESRTGKRPELEIGKPALTVMALLLCRRYERAAGACRRCAGGRPIVQTPLQVWRGSPLRSMDAWAEAGFRSAASSRRGRVLRTQRMDDASGESRRRTSGSRRSGTPRPRCRCRRPRRSRSDRRSPYCPLRDPDVLARPGNFWRPSPAATRRWRRAVVARPCSDPSAGRPVVPLVDRALRRRLYFGERPVSLHRVAGRIAPLRGPRAAHVTTTPPPTPPSTRWDPRRCLGGLDGAVRAWVKVPKPGWSSLLPSTDCGPPRPAPRTAPADHDERRSGRRQARRSAGKPSVAGRMTVLMYLPVRSRSAANGTCRRRGCSERCTRNPSGSCCRCGRTGRRLGSRRPRRRWRAAPARTGHRTGSSALLALAGRLDHDVLDPAVARAGDGVPDRVLEHHPVVAEHRDPEIACSAASPSCRWQRAPYRRRPVPDLAERVSHRQQPGAQPSYPLAEFCGVDELEPCRPDPSWPSAPVIASRLADQASGCRAPCRRAGRHR